MSVRTTIMLLILLAALGGYVFWSGQSQAPVPAPTSSVEETKIALLSIQPTEVQAIRVRDAAGLTIELAQENDQGKGIWTWKQAQAPASPESAVGSKRHMGIADAFEVTHAITDLVQLTATQIITPTQQGKAGLSPYGLAAPSYTIELLGRNKKTPLALLHLGDKHPFGITQYVQRGNEPSVYLVNGSTLDSLTRWLYEPPEQPTPVPTSTPTPKPKATVKPSPTHAPKASPKKP